MNNLYFNYSDVQSVDPIYLIFGIAWLLINVIARMRLYKKAGKSSISAIIPIYSDIVMCRIVNVSPWLLLLSIIPFINIIWGIYYLYLNTFRLARLYGKGCLFGLGLIFFNPLFIMILGYGESEYVG